MNPINKAVTWLLGITLCIYIQTLSFDFVNLDDPSHLDNNPYFSPLTASSYLELWTKPHFLYMPVTYTFWTMGILASPPRARIPVSVTGVPKEFRFSPMIFHLFTFFFHLLTVLFVFFCLFIFSQNPWVCFWGALFFSIHPLQAEPVSWVSSLKDTLSGALFFAALYVYFVRKNPRLSLVLYLAAIASKPSAVVLPPILFLISVFHFKEDWRITLKKILPFAGVTVPILWMTAGMQATDTLHFQAPSFFEKWLVAIDAIGFYIWKLIWPFDLAVDYGRTPAYALTKLPIYGICVAIVAFISLLVVYLRKHGRRQELLGLLFALICVVPVLGFKPFSFQTTSTVSDRFMYLALFGIAVALLPSLEFILKKPKTPVFLGIVFLLMGLRTIDQTTYWRDTVSMFERSIQVNPRSWLSYNNLGSHYERMDQPKLALEYYRKAAATDRQGIFFNNIGSVCLTLKDYPCAVNAYREALNINPLSSIDQNGLGFSYLGLGDKQKAREAFETSLRLNPTLEQSRIGLQMAGR